MSACFASVDMAFVAQYRSNLLKQSLFAPAYVCPRRPTSVSSVQAFVDWFVDRPPAGEPMPKTTHRLTAIAVKNLTACIVMVRALTSKSSARRRAGFIATCWVIAPAI